MGEPAAFFTPEDARRYQRGWPHVVELVDGHPDDARPEASLKKLYRHFFGAYHGRWPRKVAELFARTMSASLPEWPVKFEQTPERVAALKEGAPVDAALAQRMLELHLTKQSRWAPEMQAHALFAVEAFAGTDAVLGALIDALEALPRSKWEGQDGDANQCVAYYAFLSAYLLLRASPTFETKARARLVSLHESAERAKLALVEQTLRGGLDLALHGDDGARRVLANSHWQYLHWYGFVTDLALLRERLANTSKAEWNPNARLIFTCGAELIDDFTTPKAVRKTTRWRSAWLDHLGMFKHEGIVRLMVEQIGDKAAGSLPVQWLKGHADYAVPRVERMARGGGALEEKARVALHAMA